ncbi:MAG: hypothetical protein MZW92_28875 [Comamonadaceae bacterium]|nr:hypothetical protein [Comamonadaceae bacterium]
MLAFGVGADPGGGDRSRSLGSQRVRTPVVGRRWSSWARPAARVVARCSPCWPSWSSHGERLDVRSIDVLRRRDAIAEWDTVVIPTRVFLDGTGRELERHVGFLSADGIRACWLARHRIHLPMPRRGPPA